MGTYITAADARWCRPPEDRAWLKGAGRCPPLADPSIAKLPNPARSEIPVARIADMLLNPGSPYDFNGDRKIYPDVRLVYWAGGNPFHHHQDLNRLIKAWRRPETIVVHDPWWTATARFADIVLPATTTLERNDLGYGNMDRFILAMKKIVEPVGEARDDVVIFTELARRLGVANEFTQGRNEFDWLEFLYNSVRGAAAEQGIDVPAFPEFWGRGVVELPATDEPRVIFSDFRCDPLCHPLTTPSTWTAH
jgi:biotin/methionine sulfoxide reductase